MIEKYKRYLPNLLLIIIGVGLLGFTLSMILISTCLNSIMPQLAAFCMIAAMLTLILGGSILMVGCIKLWNLFERWSMDR